jgi:tRNA(fMet)-specific endonuclease VapC
MAGSLFFTNERPKSVTLVERDQHSAFQAELELHCPQGFVARRDPQARRQDGGWDQLVNALPYRDASEYGVGHNVGMEIDLDTDGGCTRLRTTWIPRATVEKVSPRPDVGCELGMEELDRMASEGFPAIRGALMPLVELYETWIQEQAGLHGLQTTQQKTAEHLLANASSQAKRIARGIEALAEPDIRNAFAIANRTMAATPLSHSCPIRIISVHLLDAAGQLLRPCGAGGAATAAGAGPRRPGGGGSPQCAQGGGGLGWVSAQHRSRADQPHRRWRSAHSSLPHPAGAGAAAGACWLRRRFRCLPEGATGPEAARAGPGAVVIVLLEPDILIDLITNHPPQVAERIDALAPNDSLAMSFITWATLRQLDLLARQVPVLDPEWPAICRDDAVQATALKGRGSPIGANDLWIACHAPPPFRHPPT